MKLLLLAIAAIGITQAQCAMCFRTAESQNQARSQVLNRGIAIMLVPAFSGMALIAALAWRRR